MDVLETDNVNDWSLGNKARNLPSGSQESGSAPATDGCRSFRGEFATVDGAANRLDNKADGNCETEEIEGTGGSSDSPVANHFLEPPPLVKEFVNAISVIILRLRWYGFRT